MAVTITKDLTDIWDGQTTSVWSATAPSTSPDSVTPRHGTASCSWGVGITTAHYWVTITSTNLNNNNVYFWVYSNVPNTYANGGYRIVLGDGTHRRAYYVGGSDRSGFQFGSWSCVMLDTRNLPINYAQILGTLEPNLSAITNIGVGYNHLGKAVAGALTCHVDIGRYGNGLIIGGGTSGSPGNFLEIAADDASTSTGKAYGIVRRISEGLYTTQGSLTFGNTASDSSYFEEKESIILFEDNGAGNNTYNLNVVGNTTGTNSFILGEKLGTGDSALGINGVTLLSGGPHVNINFSNNNVNILNSYGTIFSNLGLTNDIKLDTLTTQTGIDPHEIISNTFSKSGKIVPGISIIRESIFTQTDSDSSLEWSNIINIKNSRFIANTIAIEHPDFDQSPYTYDGLLFTGNDYDIINTSGQEITIDAVNGSNPSTYSPTGNTVTINNPITLTLTGLITNTEVRLIRQSDRVEIGGVENSTTTFTYNYNYSGDISIYIHIHNLQYQFIRLPIILSESNVTIPIQQIFDRNYSNPS